MATVETIGTTGRDYSTLQAWEDAVPSTPTGGYEGHCYNDSEFTAGVLIDGHTTSGANYILLTAATGQSFQDHGSVRSNALFYDQTKGVGVSADPFAQGVAHISDSHTRVTRLQFERTGASYAAPVGDVDAGLTSSLFKDCIFIKTANEASNVLRIRDSAAYNCLVVEAGAGTSTGLSVSAGTARNITVVRAVAAAGTGVAGSYSALVENIAFFGWSTGSSGSFHASSGYNCTDAASAPGSNNQVSKTFANQFESTTVDFRLKTGSDCIDNGNTDGTNAPNDISGTARGTTTDGDIGCWEYAAVAGGSLSIVPLIQNYRNMGLMQ